MYGSVRRFVTVISLSFSLTLAIAACGQVAQPHPLPLPSVTGSAAVHPPSSPTVTPPASTGTPFTSGPSEAGRLAAFFAAAARLDSRLHHAAALINGGVGATGISVRPATLAAVRGLTPAPVARAIPAGLPRPMLRSALLVYSDLESRVDSLRFLALAGSPTVVPRGGATGRTLLRCLANGAPAAARYDGDVAALRARAQAAPSLASAPPQSRAAGELALRIRVIQLANLGCGSCGGRVFTTLLPITWHPKKEIAPGSGSYSNGTIGGISFLAAYRPGHGWSVLIYAC